MERKNFELSVVHPVDGPMFVAVHGTTGDVVSAGADGDVKISSPITDFEFDADASTHLVAVSDSSSTIIEGTDDAVTALALSPEGDEILVGLENGQVNVHEYPSGMLQSCVHRFTLPVRALAYHGTPSCGGGGAGFYVCGGEEPGLQVISRSDASKIMLLDKDGGSSGGGGSGYRSLAGADPGGEYIAGTTIEGDLKVHFCPSGTPDDALGATGGGHCDPMEIEEGCLVEAGIAPRDDGSDKNSAMRAVSAWHPSGDCLAVPGREFIVLKYRPLAGDDVDRSAWREHLLVSSSDDDNLHLGPISALAWAPSSPGGSSPNLLASAGLTDSRVVLWDVALELPLAVFSNSQGLDGGAGFENAVSSLSFGNFGRGGALSSYSSSSSAPVMLAVGDRQGKLGVWAARITGKNKNMHEEGTSAAAAAAAAAVVAGTQAAMDDDDDGLGADSDDDEAGVPQSVGKEETSKHTKKAMRLIDDEAENDDDDDEEEEEEEDVDEKGGGEEAEKNEAKKKADKKANKKQEKEKKKGNAAKEVGSEEEEDEDGDFEEEDHLSEVDDLDNLREATETAKATLGKVTATETAKATAKEALESSDDDDDEGGEDGDYDEGDEAKRQSDGDDGDDDDLTAAFSPEGGFPSAALLQSVKPLQPSFMPGSTPVADERRIMCWNKVGCVTSLTESSGGLSSLGLDDVRTIEVEFADVMSSTRRVRFSDKGQGLCLGALSEDCAVFANQPLDEEDDEEDLELAATGASELVRQATKKGKERKRGTSLVYCSVFNAATTKGSSWTRSLAEGEKAVAVAAGKGWSCVATDSGLVRVYGLGGLECDVFHAPGKVLSAVGQGRRLLLTHHASASDTQVHFQVLDMVGKRLVHTGRLPLKPTLDTGGESAAETTLDWIGFAEPHTMPVFMDSSGLLSGLTSNFGGSWVPLLEANQAVSNSGDRLWPVSVLHGKLQAVVLKSSIQLYPSAEQRPLLQSLPLCVPGSQAPYSTFDTELEQASLTGKALRGAGVADTLKHVSSGAGAGGNGHSGGLGPGVSGDGTGRLASRSELEEASAVSSEQSVGVDRTLLKLMQAACVAERYEAALDAVRLLTLPKSFEIALSIANFSDLPSLAPSVEEIKLEKLACDEVDNEEEEEEVEYAVPTPRSREQQRGRQQQQQQEVGVGARRVSFGGHKTPPAQSKGQSAVPVSPGNHDDGDDGHDSDLGGFDEGAEARDSSAAAANTNEASGFSDDDEDEEELLNNEAELQSGGHNSPAKKGKPFNPFGKKEMFSAVASPPRKRKGVFEMLGGVQASPMKHQAAHSSSAELPNKKAKKKLITRDSSFSVAARMAVSKQRGVL